MRLDLFAMFANLPADLPETIDQAALRTVDRAIADLRRGELVVVEGSDGAVGLALAAEAATEAVLDQQQQLAGAPPVLAVTRRRASVLGLAAEGAGVMTLTSADDWTVDRVRSLIDPVYRLEEGTAPLPADLTATPADLHQHEGAAVALAKLGRLLPAALVAPLRLGTTTSDVWASRHDRLTVRAGDIADYQVHAARSLTQITEAPVPLAEAERARIVAFRPRDGAAEHLAIVIGDPNPEEPVLARLHSECFTGDLLGSLRCDCGDQLRGAIAEIAQAGSGVLLYLAQEGRGIGLINKLRAYRLQDHGYDTIDANELLGFEADERVYLPAAEMLRQLGFTRVRLLTNNPDKLRQLARCGIEVIERVAHVFPGNGHNSAYLRTKALRSGHLL